MKYETKTYHIFEDPQDHQESEDLKGMSLLLYFFLLIGWLCLK